MIDKGYSSHLHVLSQGTQTDWKTSKAEIKGINWARNAETVTHGIWIWKKPFIITAPSGKKVRLDVCMCNAIVK